MTVRSVVSAVTPYRHEPLGVRLHVLTRWITCPFATVLAELDRAPRGGRVLDYGCGHGVLAAKLAAERADLHVVGVDIDDEKIAAARRSSSTASYRTVATGEVPDGPWDAIALVDVLYLLPDPSRSELLERLAGALAPGGVLVLKEMAAEPRAKAGWMRLQERLAVDVFRVTEGEALAFTDARAFVAPLAARGLEVTTRAIDRWYPWPHHLVVARRPPAS